MENEFRFQDIFDVGELQKLMRALSESLEVGLAIRSPRGERYTEDCDFCDLCRLIKQTKEGQVRCEMSDRVLSGYKPKSPYICNCKSGGLVDAGINIMIGDVHIASILAGQNIIKEYEYTEEEYRAVARELGIEEEVYLEALSKVPRKTKKQFDSMLEALSLIAKQLSKLGCNNLNQKVMIDSMSNHEQALQREKRNLESLAERDALTGLYNRRKLEDVMRNLGGEEREKNEGQMFMVSIDVNNLKPTNDIFGHESGDQLLRVVAKYLEKLAGSDWIVARCGGDEFRVLAVGVDSKEVVLNYCKRAQRNCRKDSSLNIPASFSYGIAQLKEEESFAKCFERADEAMYEYKSQTPEKQNFPDYIVEKLYDRNIIDKAVVDATLSMAEKFSKYMEYDEEMSDRVRKTILYQDMGMVQIPERVMIRTSNVTDETWKYLHAHPSAGYQLARQFDKTYQVADIILQTHEAWDGKGYPKGLSGEDICMEARVARLLSNYCYWITPSDVSLDRTPEEVRQMIEKNSGKVFDPLLVERFFSFLEADGQY